MANDDTADRAAQTRRFILSRRARFVRLALTGAGMAAGTQACSPCLSVEPERRTSEITVPAVPGDQGADGGPATTSVPRIDAGQDAATTPGAELEPSTDLDASAPMVCLRVALQPAPDASAPRPCLSIRPPTSPSAAPRICLSDEIIPGQQ